LSTENKLIVYVQLLNEGTIVYRPTTAISMGPNVVKLLEPSDFDSDEEWEFPVGAVVTVSKMHLSGAEVLVATGRGTESKT
jgi:hypothetical protein